MKLILRSADETEISFTNAEMDDIYRIVGAMNNPCSIHFETDIMEKLFIHLMEDDEDILRDINIPTTLVDDVFNARHDTPSQAIKEIENEG